jgi:hypothetical protein
MKKKMGVWSYKASFERKQEKILKAIKFTQKITSGK